MLNLNMVQPKFKILVSSTYVHVRFFITEQEVLHTGLYDNLTLILSLFLSDCDNVNTDQ